MFIIIYFCGVSQKPLICIIIKSNVFSLWYTLYRLRFQMIQITFWIMKMFWTMKQNNRNQRNNQIASEYFWWMIWFIGLKWMVSDEGGNWKKATVEKSYIYSWLRLNVGEHTDTRTHIHHTNFQHFSHFKSSWKRRSNVRI